MDGGVKDLMIYCMRGLAGRQAFLDKRISLFQVDRGIHFGYDRKEIINGIKIRRKEYGKE